MIKNNNYPLWVQVGNSNISGEQYNQWRASLGYEIDNDNIDPKIFNLVAVKILTEEDRLSFKLRFGV